MTSSSHSTADELTHGLSRVHRASIPLFARTIETPDQAADRSMRLESIAAITAKLTSREMALLTESVSQRVREQLKAEQIPILQFVSRALSYVTVPRPCPVKLMGLAYALDLSLHHLDMPMAAQARRMGVTRASISNAAWTYCRQNGLAPSRWMRSESTTKASRQAREDYCQPIQPETETR